MPPKSSTSSKLKQRHARSHLHRTRPQRWMRGGSGVAGAAAVEVPSQVKSETESTTTAAAATSSPSSTSTDTTSKMPPVSSLFTDYWHLESGGVEWRSEWLKQQQLLMGLEQHLLQASQASTGVTKKKKKKKSKKKKLTAQDTNKKKKESDSNMVDLTEDDVEPSESKEPTSSKSAVDANESSSSSSDEEPEVDIDSFLSFAHQTAYGETINPATLKRATSTTKGRSKRGKKRTIRDDDEGEGSEQEERKELKRKELDNDVKMESNESASSSAASAAAVSSSTSVSLTPSIDHPFDVDDEDHDPLDAELRSMGSNLKGILSSFHSSRRKLFTKLRAKRKREEAALSKGKVPGQKKRKRSPERNRGRRKHDEDDLEFPRTPSPEVKRKKNLRTHKVTMWIDEKAKKTTAAAANVTDASTAAAASSSVIAPATAASASSSSSSLPPTIESRLASSPCDFLPLGFLTLRQDGPVATEKIAQADSIRITFSQRLIPSTTQIDPEEAVRVYFRLNQPPTEEQKARLAAEAAEKRRLAKERRRLQEELELQSGIPMDLNLVYDEEEEKTQANNPDQDELLVSTPIVWHPSAVISTHHTQTIRIQQPTISPINLTSTSASSTAWGGTIAASSSSSSLFLPSISSRVMESLFFLFSKQYIYLYPVYSARHHWFKLYVYLMPHVWSRDQQQFFQSGPRVENELMCQHLQTILNWSCQPTSSPAHNNQQPPSHHSHFNPHALFESCRPPAISEEDDQRCALFRSLEDRLVATGLKPTLRPYQKQALLWLLQREHQPWSTSLSKRFDVHRLNEADITGSQQKAVDDDLMEVDGEEDAREQKLIEQTRLRLKPEYMASWSTMLPPQFSHPFNTTNVAPSAVATLAPNVIHFNVFTGSISSVHPSLLETMDEVRGGILSEEMGLGKTLETLALVLLNPRARSSYGNGVPIYGDLGGAIIPILPRTTLPKEGLVVPYRLPTKTTSNQAATSSSAVTRPAPPLLIDPLELSQKAYNFYQNQLSRTASNTPAVAAASPPSSRIIDIDSANSDGEAEYGAEDNSSTPEPPKEIACFCGHDVTFFHDSNEELVECQACHKYQHALCMRMNMSAQEDARISSHPFQPNPPYPYTYLCPTCSSLSTTPKLPIAATLIVCPDVILQQWVSEIERHINSGKDQPPIRFLVYKGVRSIAGENDATPTKSARSRKSTASTTPEIDLTNEQEDVQMLPTSSSSSDTIYSVFVATEEFISIRRQKIPSSSSAAVPKKKRAPPRKSKNPDEEDMPAAAVPTALPFSLIRPQQFAGYDVVLTTYSTLSNDLYHTATDQTQSRAHRYAKKYQVLPSPLIGVNWWRLCLDEAQMLGIGTARCAEMALMLSAQIRWNVTGTPIYKSLEDLYGLLLFLGVMPYSNRGAWKRLLATPYEHGEPAAKVRMHSMVSRLMWRNTKSSVSSQLNLPPTTYLITRIQFTPIERYYYEKRRDECRVVSTQLRQFGRAALTTIQLKKVFHSFLRMRQACCHPQVGSTGSLVNINKQTLTLSDLSLQMLKEARLQCEEIQRRTYFAIHGLAAIAIIKKEYEAAVELYERVVGVDEQELTEEYERKQLEAKSVPSDIKMKGENGLTEDHNGLLLSSPSPSPLRATPKPNYTGTRRAIAIDDLQKIHALHNLADALALSYGWKLDRIKDLSEGDDESSLVSADGLKIKDETPQIGMLTEESTSSAMSFSDHTSSSIAGVAAATASSSISNAPAALPAPVLLRLRLLKHFTSVLKASYLSKQSQLVADSQQKFNQANKTIFDSLSTRSGLNAKTWWLEALARLGSSPELESRFIGLLKRDLFAANESLVAAEKPQPSIAESFRQAAGFKYVIQNLIDELESARGQTSKKLSLQTLHQPPLESEVTLSAHCSRCRVNQNGPMCMNCKSAQMLGDYEKKLYRFRFEQKNMYLNTAGATDKQSKLNARLILPGEGRSRKEHADSLLRATKAANDGLLDPLTGGLDEFEQRHMNNFMQQSELEASLKHLLKFMTEHKHSLLLHAGREDSQYDAMIQLGKDYLNQIDLYKKELKCMFELNRVHREQLSLYDELAMSTSRIRLKYEGETVLPAEKHFKLEPWEVDDSQMTFESDIVECQANMREWTGKLRFLEAQVQLIQAPQSDHGGDHNSSTICVICQERDLLTAPEVAVLPCAHRFCVPCILFMLDRPAESNGFEPVSGKVKVIKCPSCRNKTAKREIAYVTNVKKDEGQMVGGAGSNVPISLSASTTSVAAPSSASSSVTTSSSASGPVPSQPVYPFKGSWSTKIHSVLQCILHVLATDSTNKILIFSEWLDVLTIIQQALRANSISFLQIGSGSSNSKRSLQESLKQFKSNPMIPVLLLPLNTAASGLNIVEANHIILVEPNLSPGKESQAVGRIVRIGQLRPTTVHRFIVENSVEEKIFAMNAHHRVKEAEAITKSNQHEAQDGDDDSWLPESTKVEDHLDANDFMNLLDEEEEKKEVTESTPAADVSSQPTNATNGSIGDSPTTEDADMMDDGDEEMRDALQASADEFQQPQQSTIRTTMKSEFSPNDERKESPHSITSVAIPSASVSTAATSCVLHPNESAFLATLDAEHATLSDHHRYWTGLVRVSNESTKFGSSGPTRTMNRLQALMLLQRQQFFGAAAGPDTTETTGSSSELYEYQGKLLSKQVIQLLQQLPHA